MNKHTAIHAVLVTFSTGHMEALYVPLSGSLTGQLRRGFLNSAGKPVRSLPASAEVESTRLPSPIPDADPAKLVRQAAEQVERDDSRERRAAAQTFNSDMHQPTGRVVDLTEDQAEEARRFFDWCKDLGLPMEGFCLACGVDVAKLGYYDAPTPPAPSTPPAEAAYTNMVDVDGSEVLVEVLPTDKWGNTLPQEGKPELTPPTPAAAVAVQPAPKARKARKASAPRKSSIAGRDGYTWQEFLGLCRAESLHMREAGQLWRMCKGKSKLTQRGYANQGARFFIEDIEKAIEVKGEAEVDRDVRYWQSMKEDNRRDALIAQMDHEIARMEEHEARMERMEAEAKLEREAEEGRRIMAKVGAHFAETGADFAVMTLGSDEVSGPDSYGEFDCDACGATLPDGALNYCEARDIAVCDSCELPRESASLPYMPESERGNPQPQYGKVEWPCPSAEAIEAMAEACADDTRAYLASIEARLN